MNDMMANREAENRKRAVGATILFAFLFVLPVWGLSANKDADKKTYEKKKVQDDIEVVVSTDKRDITVGELVEYTVTVTYPENENVNLPAPGTTLGQFEIRDYEESEKQSKLPGRKVHEAKYIITTYDTGEYFIPPMKIDYGKGKKKKSFKAKRIKLNVKSIRGEGAEGIKDIRGPVEVPSRHLKQWALLGLYILAGVAGVVALALALRWLFGRKAGGAMGIGKRRPPHEVAMERLGKLENLFGKEKWQPKVFYSELTEILREYVNGHYRIPTFERTTTEILTDLRRERIADQYYNMARQVLNDGDLVKFAKWQAPVDKAREDVATVRSVISGTTHPADEEEQEAVAGGAA